MNPASPAPSDQKLHEAVMYFQVNRLGEAEYLLREILQDKPDHEAALNELGRTLHKQGRLDDAISCFRRLTGLRPDLALAHKNLAIMLCEHGRFEESFASFRRHAELFHAHRAAPADACIPQHKIRHDLEQRDYLKTSLGIDHDFHIADGLRVTGFAVNPDAYDGNIAEDWRSHQPQIVVIDDFLMPDALVRLQNYCTGSTIWRQAYEGGYLGALPEHGLGSPLLAQIAEELRQVYPAIFHNHPLRQFWGFKYDSEQNGIAVHADFAAVNVNFWITPDEANLDAHSGGLVIWDKPAPLNWSFERYNDDVAATRAFLQEAEARSVTIPYRCNRAVIFNSNLFHETDRIHFKSGYTNRRINLTLLYGNREDAA